MWEINSVGDIDFLLNIFQGVAMLTGSSTMKMGAALGALMGILVILIMGLASGGKELRIDQVLIGWIGFVIFFGTTASVQINDRYSGRSEIVANVPWGMAMVGSVFSTVGTVLTEKMEQAFSWPGMTETHYGGALSTLIAGRMVTQSPDKATGKYLDTLRAYIRDCTLTGVELGEISYDRIVREPSALEAMKVTGSLYTTQSWLEGTGDQPTDVTCNAAWQRLNSFNTQPIADKGLQPALGTNGTAQIGQAYVNLNQALTNQQQYMQNLYVASVWNEAVAQGYAQRQDEASAAILVSANTQRQIQFASEENMFLRMERPMLAFFEGLMYALAPIMSFVIVFGSVGFRIFGKYVLMGLWVQLWMPIFAVINLFQHIAMTRYLDALTNNGATTVQSIQSILLAQDKAADWVSLGGMLAAATPALALAIVYQGSVAMSSLSSKIGGGDSVNEKLGAPDVADSSPLLKTGEFYKSDQAGGLRMSGSDGLMAKIGTNMASQSSLSSMERETTAAQESFADQVSASFRKEGFDRGELSSQLGLKDSSTAGWASDSNAGRDVLDGSSLQRQVQASRSRAESANVGMNGSLGANGGGAGGSVSGGLGQSVQTADQSISSTSQGGQSHYKSGEGSRASFGHQAAMDIASGHSKLLGMMKSESAAKELQRSAQDVLRKEQAFESATKFSQDMSRGHSIDAKTAAHMLSVNGGSAGVDALSKKAQDLGSKEAYNKYYDEATKAGPNGLPLFASETEARAYAALMTLSDDKNYIRNDGTKGEEGLAQSRREAFFGAMSQISGLGGMASEAGAASSTSASANHGIAQGVHEMGAVERRASHIQGPSGVSGTLAAAEGSLAGADQRLQAAGANALHSEQQTGHDHVQAGKDTAWASHTGAIQDDLKHQAATIPTERSIPEEISGAVHANMEAFTLGAGMVTSGYDAVTQQAGYQSAIHDQLGGGKESQLAAQYGAARQADMRDFASESSAAFFMGPSDESPLGGRPASPEVQGLRSQMVARYGEEIVGQFDRDLGAGAYMKGEGAASASASLIHSWDRKRPE